MKLSELPDGPNTGDVICQLSDIEDGKALEFSYGSGTDSRDIFIQRVGDAVFAYENNCPHAHIPMNMKEGVFTEKSGKYIMCANHGALFEMNSGKCVAGPCNGQFLTEIELDLVGGDIIAR